MIQEMNTMRTTLVAPDILQNALNFMAGKFAMSLENPGIIAQYAINIERYKMPKDYYKNYLKTLSAVTAADVQAVAQQYIHPGQANIVVVGNKSEAEKLKAFSADGTLRYFDNYGNEIQAVVTKAVAEGVTAQSVLDKYIQAIGGKKAIEDIRTLVMVSSTEMQGTPIRITQKLASPGKFRMAIEAMGMVVQKIVLNQDKGYMEAQGQKQDLTEDQVTVFQRQADMQADLHPDQYGLSYHLLGTEAVDGKDAYVLEELSKDGRKSTRYYDVASGLLVKSINEGEMMGQKMVQTNIYGDYREVKNGKGFKVPFSLEQTPPGMKVSIQSAEANVTLKDADFK